MSYTQDQPARTRVYGVAGGSLKTAAGDWLSTSESHFAEAGRQGELRTAVLLDELASQFQGPHVLHDLRTPSAKYKANIDHIIVSGQMVHVIDSKLWRPGFYWTFGGKSRNGTQRVKHAEKQTMTVIQKALEGYLRAQGIPAVVVEPTVVVWSSSIRKTLSVWALRFPGAHVLTGPAAERSLREKYKGAKDGDPRIISALAELLLSKPQGSERVATTPFTTVFDQPEISLTDEAPTYLPPTGTESFGSAPDLGAW